MGLDDDIVDELELVLLGHSLVHLPHLTDDFLREILLGTFPLEDADVEVGEFGVIEVEGHRAVRQLVVEICTGPVDDRHKIVANRTNSLLAEVLEAFAVIGDKSVATRSCVLDFLADRKALDHGPSHSVGLYFLPEAAYRFPAPNLAVRYFVKGRDYAFDPNLSKCIQRDDVISTKPSPCFFHMRQM